MVLHAATIEANTREQMILENMGLVGHIAKSFRGTKLSIEDLRSIGSIGLIKAVDTFDTQKNAKFSNYAGVCITNEINMHLRKVKKQYKEISLDFTVKEFESDGDELSLSAFLGTDIDYLHDVVENRQLRLYIQQRFNLLEEREKLLVKRFIDKKVNGITTPQWQIANQLGFSQDYISRLEKKAVRKFSDLLREVEQCADG